MAIRYLLLCENISLMNTLERYIAIEVIKGSFMASLILLSLLSFFTFADELGDIGQGDYHLATVLKYLLLTLPHSFYELMPSAALVGSLVTLGNLANHRELMAMQSAGVSRTKIICATLAGGIALLVVSISIGELIAPSAQRTAQSLKALAQKKQVASRSKYGFWVRDGQLFINIREIQRQEELGNIHLYEVNDKKRLVFASHVEKAIYDGIQWKLKKIRTTRFQEERVISETKEFEDWTSVLAPDLLNVFVIRPENLSSWELSHYIDYLNENGQRSLLVEQAFWGRLVNPFVTLVMLLAAMPFVLTLRREVSIGQRIVLGVVIGLGFYLFDRMFNHFGLIYEMNAIFTAVFPAIVALAGVSLGLLKLHRK